MRVALMTEPQQGLSYLEILAIARAAEAAGFEGFFRSDHFTSFPGPAGERTTDAWATLAGLARETSRIQLGALVSPVTFRIPGSFAKLVTTVDEMSGGRVEIGVGAGWNEEEHRELGIPYPTDAATRVDMLEEQLAILVGLLDEPDGWTFEGEHWQVRRTLFRPRYDGSEPRADGRRRPNSSSAGSVDPVDPPRRAIRGRVTTCRRPRPPRWPRSNARIDTASRRWGAIPRPPTLGHGGRARRRDERGSGSASRHRSRCSRTTGPGGIVDGGPQGSLGRRDDGRGTHPHGRVRGAGADRIMLQDFLPARPRPRRAHGRAHRGLTRRGSLDRSAGPAIRGSGRCASGASIGTTAHRPRSPGRPRRRRGSRWSARGRHRPGATRPPGRPTRPA